MFSRLNYWSASNIYLKVFQQTVANIYYGKKPDLITSISVKK